MINIRNISTDLKAYLGRGGSGIALSVRAKAAGEGEISLHHTGILFDMKNMRDNNGTTILEVKLRERVRVEDVSADGPLLMGE